MRYPTPKQLQRRLLNWGSSNQREFVWRSPSADEWTVLVSEMLLRKTTARAVEPVVREVLRRFPTPQSMADLDVATLEELLRPLGLHRIRARAVLDVARAIREEHAGHVPEEYETLVALPHVGRYIANAVLCFAHGQRRPIVDGNVLRVYGRVLGLERPREVHKDERVWAVAERMLPESEYRAYNLALLDLGATVCTPRRPSCGCCPLRGSCPAADTEA